MFNSIKINVLENRCLLAAEDPTIGGANEINEAKPLSHIIYDFFNDDAEAINVWNLGFNLLHLTGTYPTQFGLSMALGLIQPGIEIGMLTVLKDTFETAKNATVTEFQASQTPCGKHFFENKMQGIQAGDSITNWWTVIDVATIVNTLGKAFNPTNGVSWLTDVGILGTVAYLFGEGAVGHTMNLAQTIQLSYGIPDTSDANANSFSKMVASKQSFVQPIIQATQATLKTIGVLGLLRGELAGTRGMPSWIVPAEAPAPWTAIKTMSAGLAIYAANGYFNMWWNAGSQGEGLSNTEEALVHNFLNKLRAEYKTSGSPQNLNTMEGPYATVAKSLSEEGTIFSSPLTPHEVKLMAEEGNTPEAVRLLTTKLKVA